MKKLKLSPTLSLPLDFATEGVAVIGMRGSGKSNTEARFAELLDEAGVPFVAVDPKGDWHGIRSSADGKRPGLSVPVFGGLHGDFPLEQGSGAQIADLLIDNNISAVLDVSMMSKSGGMPTFLTAFFNQLMHRHQLDPHVRTAILEEAHRYIPQVVRAEHARLKEAAAALLLEGRAFGLGCWAATQRPARLNKDVLEEVGSAIIHRIGVAATNDKKTIAGWVKHYELSDEIVDSLTSLAPGEAWVLSPESGIVQRVQMDRRTTFDSAATPKVGAARRKPVTMAEIDVGAITEALASAIERAKDDDPRELRRRLKERDRELESLRQDLEIERQRQVEVETVEKEIPVISTETLEHLEELLGPHAGLLSEVQEVLCAFRGGLRTAREVEAVRSAPPPRRPAPATTPTRHTRPERATPSPRGSARSSSESSTAAGGVGIPRGKRERAILAALAQYPDGRTQKQLALLCGYSSKASTVGAGLSELRSVGLVERGGVPRLTEAGHRAAADAGIEPLPSGPELLAYWRGELGSDSRERRIFELLLADDGLRVSRTNDEIAELLGYNAGTSTVGAGISKLRTLGLVARGTPPHLSNEFLEAVE